ncbi:MAG: CRISPR-associated helicase Cas3' [Caldilineaceae bacterium]
MARITEQAKESQMELIFLRVKGSPYGITQAEIAEATGIHPRTVNNYLRDLKEEGKVKKEGRLWFLEIYEEIRNLKFEITPEEAYTYYLGSRLFVKQHDKRNRLAETALMKLADALAANRLVGHEIAQAARELAQRPGDTTYETIFQTMVRGYLQRKRVAITYKPLNGSEFHTTFETYLMEPSAIGYATYIIGHSSLPNARRAYKLERICKAELLDDEYRIPTDFPGLEILRNSWSIIMGEELVKVELRFSPRVKERVRETQWHPSQDDDHDETKTKDDSLLWWVYVAGTTDIEPWIRSWGADVEVIEPEELVNKTRKHVQWQAQMYSVVTADIPSNLDQRLLRCWGKTGSHEQDFHPALYHMLDVAHIAQQLLNTPASKRWRNILAHALQADTGTLNQWLPWFVAMHDIGKVSVPFQAQNQAQKVRLEGEGFQFGHWKPKDTLYHTDVGRYYLRNEFAEFELPEWLHRAWLEMIGGHHGVYATTSLSSVKRTLLHGIHEPAEWAQLRKRADQILQSILLVQPPQIWPEPTNVSAAIMALTGFTILCDWLGSDGRYFKPHVDIALLDYVRLSRRQAYKAVGDAGFFQLVCSKTQPLFTELFPERQPARPLQSAIDQIPTKVLGHPCLVIIEAPTGEGKTEAAFTVAHRIGLLRGSDEFYCALPTTATSNQMFIRTHKYLQKNLNLPTQTNLIHGQSFLVEDDLRIEPLSNGDTEFSEAVEWFAPKKRALLAPFGVGTIDQAELAALNVRHNALRLIGLAGKVVILDEVHAYDTYMTTIIEQMLRWLSALSSSVILLSATLPTARRAALATAYGVTDEAEVTENACYPSLWVGSKGGINHDTPAAYQPERVFHVSPIHIGHDDATEKATWLLEQVSEDGNACWIANTVERAQRLYEEIGRLDRQIERYLLHARFPLEDRQRLEKLITQKHGPEGVRPKRSIVIGTQVLEQSLDLDFDLMVSDLAPIDLLLQRMGRLHRHQNKRPAHHQVPHLYVNCEVVDDGSLLKMGADRFYGEYILQKSWQAIKEKEQIVLPQDYRPLVEAVYDSNEPSPDDPLRAAWEKLIAKEDVARGEANLRLTPAPEPDRLFCANNNLIYAEDEESAAWVVAQTRLGAESVTVLPLAKIGDEAQLIPTEECVNLTVAPTRETELRLLRRSLRISRYEVVQHFKQMPPADEALFKRSALLKNVKPLWLDGNGVEIVFDGKPIKLSLDAHLGLVIEKGAG